jgi:hypothetical protein
MTLTIIVGTGGTGNTTGSPAQTGGPGANGYVEITYTAPAANQPRPVVVRQAIRRSALR